MSPEKPKIILTSTFLSEFNKPHRTTALLCAYTSLDCDVEGLDARKIDIYDEIKKEQPIAVGLSVTTYGEFTSLSQKIDLIKKISSSSLVVVGGRYATLFSDRVFKEAKNVDILITGYAEQSWSRFSEELALLQHIEPQKRLSILKSRLEGYPGIYFSNGSTIPNDLSPRIKLKHVKQPAYNNLRPKVRQYFQEQESSSLADLYESRTGVNVLSGIGCEYNCAFCVNGAMKVIDGPKELRPPSNVVEEISMLVDLAKVPKLPVFLACPDSFDQYEHLVDILTMLDKRNLSKLVAISVDSTVKSFYKTVNKNPAIVKNMKDKIWRVLLGVESFDEKIQEYIGKPQTVDEIAWTLQSAADMGIIPVVQILIGLPPESNETLENSLRQLLLIRDSVSPFAINVHRAIPFPGTLYYSDAVQNRLINSSNKNLLSDITVGESIIGSRNLTKEEVTAWIKKFLYEFHTDEYLKRVSQDPRRDLAAELMRQSNKSKLKA